MSDQRDRAEDMVEKAQKTTREPTPDERKSGENPNPEDSEPSEEQHG